MSDINIGSSYYTGLMDTLKSTTGKKDVSTALDRITDESTDEELMEACKSFESYFVEQMYKGMEKTIMRDESREEGDYLSYFKDTLYQSYAKLTTESGGLGIAQTLYESMKNKGVDKVKS